MHSPLPQPLLAVLFSEWTCVAVIVMMFVGWIVNLINNSKNRPAPARPGGGGPQRRSDERLQGEIDRFLDEVGGGKRRDADEELLIEIVPDEEQARRRRPQSLPPVAVLQEPDDSPLTQRHLESSIGATTLGSELRDHLTDYMRDDMAHTVVADLGSGVGSDWTKQAVPAAAAAFAPRPTASGIVGLLRNPATVRQAILISEVLSRPKARR